jgi:meso-butanediol dehydrogenase / (S,S)-butanediol dehydrogenase / diacetyl reductase
MMALVRLTDKVVVVTGGASGIGAACCARLAREGAQVAMLDINADGADGMMALRASVTDPDAVAAAMNACAARFGRIDGLVNSAGIAIRKAAVDLDDTDWQRVIDVNLRGAFLCSKYAIPHMRDGSIVHISSVVGLTGVRNRAAYSASKGGLIALTRNMAMDYANQRIRVNCVCPGFVRTPFTASIFADEKKKATLTTLHPLGRLGEPEDIANAILFLLSDDASWITGQAIAVDGGFTAGFTADI